MNSGLSAQSVLDPHGPAAARIVELWWVMFWIAGAISLGVIVLLLYAARRRRGPDLPAARLLNDRRATRWVLFGGAAMPLVVLTGVFIYTLGTLNAIAGPARADLVIELTGRQWWWEVHYPGSDSTEPFETANEIHIPVGQPVEIRLRSEDVIHSFWVPELQGKTDQIPGRENVTWLQADAPGVYRGQCAEYCGVQHANMVLLVVAETPEAFAAWAARQRQPAAESADPLAVRGRRAFVQKGCGVCHAVRGLTEGSDIGPDLTHIASRLTLASGILPNTKGHLGGWIADPQALKPGNKMPSVPLESEELQAILHYLTTLE